MKEQKVKEKRKKVEDRVQMLEHKVERHSKQIAKLFNKTETTDIKLDKIVLTLNQIRFTFYGAVGYYAISELGLVTALKFV